MLHPETDPPWAETAQFVRRYCHEGDRLLAPIAFRQEFTHVIPYATASVPLLAQVSWVLIHKGMMDKLNQPVLQAIGEQFKPVFANDVFVVFSNRPDLHFQGKESDPHLQAFWHEFRAQMGLPALVSSPPQYSWRDGIRRIKQQVVSLVSSSNSLLTTVLQRLNQIDQDIKDLQQTVRKQRMLIFGTKAIAALSLAEFTTACRAACHTAYLGDGTVLCRVLGKHLMYADTQDIGITPHLCLNGFWEPGLTLVIARHLQPHWYCLDVGANHGYFAVLMADAVGESGKVLALEPNPRLVNLLERTLQVNGLEHCTQVIAKAASNRDGEPINLVVPQGQTGHASITMSPGASHQIIPTETITLDTLTQAWDQVNLVKIDAEGAEEEIWRGMQTTIRRNKDIIILLEFGAARYADPKSFLKDIEHEGFLLQYVEGAAIKPITIERCLTERLDSFWMLFLQRLPDREVN